MARKTLQIPIFPANGGLNSAVNPALVDPTQMAYSNNIFYGTDLVRKTRPGLKQFSTVTTETERMQFLFDFWRYNSLTGSQSNQVIRIVNGEFEVDASAVGAFANYTNGNTINSGDIITADVFSGILILALQNSAPLMWNGTTLELLAGSPRSGSLYRTHQGSGYLSGFRNDPHAIDVSFPDNPFVWSGAGTETLTVNDGDGDPVGNTALFPSFYGDLYVGKWESVYRVRYDYTLEAFQVSLLIRGVGCVSHNSVVAVQNDILFVSDRGVHSLMTTQKYGDTESQFLSAPIQNVFKKEIDFSRSYEIQGTYIPDFNTYALTVPIKGYSGNRDMLLLNILNGQWTRFYDIDADRICVYHDVRKKRKLMTGHSDCNIAFFDEDTKLDFGTEAINVEFRTGVIYPGGAKKSIAFKSLTCIYVPKGESEFTVDYVIDGTIRGQMTFNQSGTIETAAGGYDFVLGDADLGDILGSSIINADIENSTKIETQTLTGNGRGIQLTFKRQPSGDTIEQGIEVLGFIIDFVDANTSDESTIQ